MILSALRKIPFANEKLKQGKWLKHELLGNELTGKTIGIVGFGRIGRRMAELLKPFKVRILVYDPFVNHADGVDLVDLDTLLSESDIITFHVPLTPQTRKIVNKGTIKKMKKGVILVNTARGAIFDIEAVIEGVKNGKIACVCLDVFEKEPPENVELFNHPNIIVTPHIGAQTHESKRIIGLKILEYIRGLRQAC